MPKRIVVVEGSDDYERRMAAARARASWEIGDGSWAGVILYAFLHPEEDAELLRASRGSDDRY